MRGISNTSEFENTTSIRYRFLFNSFDKKKSLKSF